MCSSRAECGKAAPLRHIVGPTGVPSCRLRRQTSDFSPGIIWFTYLHVPASISRAHLHGMFTPMRPKMGADGMGLCCFPIAETSPCRLPQHVGISSNNVRVTARCQMHDRPPRVLIDFVLSVWERKSMNKLSLEILSCETFSWSETRERERETKVYFDRKLLSSGWRWRERERERERERMQSFTS